MRGVIALDIDGTLTLDSQPVPDEVVKYLELLVQEGWQLIFITGRTFQGATRMLGTLPFHYYLAVQNGAITLEMPGCKVVAKKYLDRSIIKTMEQICADGPSDFIVYGGFEHQDICYFRPQHFSATLLNYLERRVANFKEVWLPVKDYDTLPIDAFPSVKCFGIHHEAVELVRRIESQLGLHVPLIHDPFNREYYVVQAIHSEISKGRALQDLAAFLGNQGILIAAGDDHNDCSMWDVADVRVIMETAPAVLLQSAHIVAPSASKQGIIVGLKLAVTQILR